jgi:UDP-N-acetyl-2-amino-2-deoxyglucuronate dehydrogenase
MEEKIKFALIGCGRIGERHCEQIAKYGALVAVCDIEFNKAENVAKKYGCLAFKSSDEMLESVAAEADVISVCSPNGLHAQHSISALNGGFHVLCEKPMAINSEDCGEMIHAAESANKRLFIVKQNRFNPPVKAVKELIENGSLGKIYSVQLNCFWNRNNDYYLNSWKGTLDIDGGTLFTQFSHFVDLLYWYFGDVEDLKAYANNFNHKSIIEFEDTGVVILRFKSGTLGTINYTVNSYDKNMEGSLTIFAENGTVKIGGQYLNELEYQQIKNMKIGNLPDGNKPNNYGNYTGSMSNHDLLYKNLIDVLAGKDSISANMFEGLKTVEIIERVYRQIR